MPRKTDTIKDTPARRRVRRALEAAPRRGGLHRAAAAAASKVGADRAAECLCRVFDAAGSDDEKAVKRLCRKLNRLNVECPAGPYWTTERLIAYAVQHGSLPPNGALRAPPANGALDLF